MIDERDEISAAVQAIMASRPRFAVGDPARVRLSSECRFAYESGIVHFPETDGAVGVIEASPCGCGGGHDDAHEYAVFFEPRVRWRDTDGIYRSVVSHCFAPTELERLDP